MGGVATDLSWNSSGAARPPDRWQHNGAITAPGVTIEFDAITIGNLTYEKDPVPGQWQSREGVGEQSILSPAFFFSEDVLDFSSLTFIGEENMNGVAVYHFQGTAYPGALEELGPGTARIEYWIGLEDFLVRQIVFEAEVAREDDNMSSFRATGPEGSGSVSWALTFSDFGAPVAIEPPDTANVRAELPFLQKWGSEGGDTKHPEM